MTGSNIDMRHELIGIYAVWLREFKRFYRDKARFASSIIRPLLWLFIMGLGLGRSISFANSDIDYLPFITPGIIGMSVLFTSLFSGVSVIWDREFGFLKEMLVAPISRISIIIGKALGGATASIVQATVIIFIVGFLGVHSAPSSLVLLYPTMVIVSVGFVALGVGIASLMDSMEGFNVIMNFIVMPMFMLSGALFPVQGLGGVMGTLIYLNPMTYGVEAMRYAMLGVSTMPVATTFGVIVGFSAAMSVVAALAFSRRR